MPDVHVCAATTNEYCYEWATSLSKSLSNPFITRQKIEQRKFKVIKQLNDLKRMADQARLDNHDLYRTYQILKTNKNLDVMMTILRSDSTTADPAMVEVLEVIDEHIRSSTSTSSNSNATTTSEPSSSLL